MNINNFGIIGGRLLKDPVFFANANGSNKVYVNIASPNNFKSADNQRGSQYVPLEGYIPESVVGNGNGVYGMMHQGDKVTIQYSVRTNNYIRDGERIYGIVLHIEDISLEESKATTDARLAARANAEKKAGRRNRKSA